MAEGIDRVFASWRRVLGEPSPAPAVTSFGAGSAPGGIPLTSFGAVSGSPGFSLTSFGAGLPSLTSFGSGASPSSAVGSMPRREQPGLFGDDSLPAWGTGKGALIKPPSRTPAEPIPNFRPPTQDEAGSGLGEPGPATTDLEKAIDHYTGGDSRLALAMRLGAYVEGGNLEGGWGVGDNGNSHGPYQINQGAGHKWADGRPVTPDEARDPWKATEFMVGEYRRALNTVNQLYGADLWQRDPRRAAMLTAGYAERPAMWGQNPANPYPQDRVQWAWGELQKRGWAGGGGISSTAPAVDARGAAVASAAQGYQGFKYRLGGNGTDGTIDCSGLTQQAYRRAGINLPRTAQQQFDATQRVDIGEAKVGDLVFFERTYNAGTRITHVGVYLGNGRMMSATDSGVSVQSINSPYWRQRLAGFGRVA